MTEAALALWEQKAQDLGELLATAGQEQQSLAQKLAKEHRLEQQVSGQGRRRRQAVRGGRWPTSGALPHRTPRKLQSGRLNCSETCLLPTRRTCFCETR